MLRKQVYERFLSQCDNGFVVLNKDCSISEVNNAVEKLTGFSYEELKGSELNILFDDITVEKICAIYEEFGCREINQKISGDLFQKSGSLRFVEISIICTSENDLDTQWLLIKNKSFRKEMENRLRKSELMLTATLESLPFDFWINDAENRTYMQNSHSKSLWGDVRGLSPAEVTDDQDIIGKWLESTKCALNGEVFNGETSYILDGKNKYFRNIIAPIMDDEELLGICGMNIDITDLKKSLNMREMLLKEVHHRVKNNLQMIIGIIRLESMHINPDEDPKSVFDDIIHRIEAISMVHEKLYITDFSELVNTADYIRELIDHIILGVNIENLELVYELEDLEASKDIILTVGLLINEIVTNAVKYAFVGEKKHRLEIKSKTLSGSDFAEVVISDNGPGLPDNFDNKNRKSMGFRLINVFASELNGKLVWNSSLSGAEFKFTFPIKKAGASRTPAE